MAITVKKFRESHSGKLGKVSFDGDTPVIHGALISGWRSRNGNVYEKGCYGDGKQYEGSNVYTGHKTEGQMERPPSDKLAKIVNVRIKNGLPYGDLRLNPKHSLTESVIWAAKNDPEFYGLSHDSSCEYFEDAKNNCDRITKVVKVNSVDLVNEPATTRGLFTESYRGSAVNKIKLKSFIESALDCDKLSDRKHNSLKRFLEEYDDGPMSDIDPGVEGGPLEEDMPDAMASQSIAGALIEAMKAVIAEYQNGMTDKDALAAIKSIMKTHKDLVGMEEMAEQMPEELTEEPEVETVEVDENPEGERPEEVFDDEPFAGEETEEEEDEEEKKKDEMESVRRKTRADLEAEIADLKLVREAEKMGIRLSKVQKKAALALESAERKEFLESIRPKKTKVQSGYKSKALTESVNSNKDAEFNPFAEREATAKEYENFFNTVLN